MNDRTKALIEDLVKRGFLELKLDSGTVIDIIHGGILIREFDKIRQISGYSWNNLTEIIFDTDACKFWFGEELICEKECNTCSNSRLENKSEYEGYCIKTGIYLKDLHRLCDKYEQGYDIQEIPAYQYHQMQLAILQPDERVEYIERNKK